MKPNDTLKVTARGDRELVIERRLDAPREIAWEAMTRPELVGRWLRGPGGWSTSECTIDLRPGGAFRHAWRHEDGREMAMSGTIREVAAPERLVRTERFEFGCETQAGEQLGTMTLDALDDGTTALRIVVLYPTREARDGTLASGANEGMAESYAALDDVLNELGG